MRPPGVVDKRPEDLATMLTTLPADELDALFEDDRIAALGADEVVAVLGREDCPDHFISWAAGRGVDVDIRDADGATPLWRRAQLGWAEQIPLLASLGADVDAEDETGVTALDTAAVNLHVDAVQALLQHGANPLARSGDPDESTLALTLLEAGTDDVAALPDIAQLLLDAGDTIREHMRELVTGIGEQFEFDRESIDPAEVAAAESGLSRLYEMFGVEPVAPRKMHDDVSSIFVPDGEWSDQHAALVDLLVPAVGVAPTLQAEVIRLTGYLHNRMYEAYDDPEFTWTRDDKRVMAGIRDYLASGDPLSRSELKEAAAAVKDIRRIEMDGAEKLKDLAVRWVAENSRPLPVQKLRYEAW